MVVLTRDRKKDWFFSKITTEVSEDLKRLRGNWQPVPVPHPMLTFELRCEANAELLLIDELYLGAVMWSVDKVRFGRLAAVTFGMDLNRLEAEIRPPPGVAERAARRVAADTVSHAVAIQVIRAARAEPPTDAVNATLAALEGEAPGVEEEILRFNPERAALLSIVDLASLSKNLYDRALSGPSAATVLARRLLDLVDRVDADHASAIVGGMLTGAYFDGSTPRNRPTGELLQEVYAWRIDAGISRTLAALARELQRQRSPAFFLPSATTDPFEIRIEASTSNLTAPVAVGQVYLGAQPVLVATTIDPLLSLGSVLGGVGEATVESLVKALGRHYGIPLDLLRIVDAAPDELRTILSTTGIERFDPMRQPIRPGGQPGHARHAGEPPPDTRAAPTAIKEPTEGHPAEPQETPFWRGGDVAKTATNGVLDPPDDTDIEDEDEDEDEDEEDLA